MASNEAFKKQAEGANDAAKKYMEENEKLQEVSELCMEMPGFHDPKGIQGAETFSWFQVNDQWCNYRTCGQDSCTGDCDEYSVLRNCCIFCRKMYILSLFARSHVTNTKEAVGKLV